MFQVMTRLQAHPASHAVEVLSTPCLHDLYCASQAIEIPGVKGCEHFGDTPDELLVLGAYSVRQ
jgi:hypothetical protein